MNGADVLGDTLLANGVDVCFANPGTSEMHFVAALDRRPQMRCILGLFEGVVTAAADGYSRMADRPAATLLHLGPGLANGLANLHNAKRARSPVVNIVGDHATYHLPYDAPLTSDIESLARPMSNWVGRIALGDDVGKMTAEAIWQARQAPGVSTLILPADVAWSDVGGSSGGEPRPVSIAPQATRALPERSAIEAGVQSLRSGGRIGLLLGGQALRSPALEWAGRLAAATGATLLAEMFNARIERGRGRVPVAKVLYRIDASLTQLADYETLILIGASVPVAFFGYPGKPSLLIAEGCEVVQVAGPHHDLVATLQALAEDVGASRTIASAASAPQPSETSDLSTGPLDGETVCRIVARRMPEGAVVCDESLTAGFSFFAHSQAAAPHDYLQLTGGAIGIGIPLAAGAAVASPGRKVIGLQADGSGMYTVQGLWTQAREGLDVVTVIFSNRAYAILHGEMANVGVNAIGRNAARMLNLDDPALDWVSLAKGLGVEAARATTAVAFDALFAAAMTRPGPFLIEAVLEPS
ncbi:acetolactate synthase large subunit [Lichenihabitans sp. PAMC28606]|uniref:acetolactate synthase large subunit n=1 Tax=Lichenihabitans sp. PAMC28606 TaxID=2880932 RepID=UPI001D0AFC1F|nr:acetolactate synthase large subunit [Lichenihabitans sp. PAMC28606]UDL95009.1 acetolactate synthase large subunit [Lichenihabitans sp. PAMC28606]